MLLYEFITISPEVIVIYPKVLNAFNFLGVGFLASKIGHRHEN